MSNMKVLSGRTGGMPIQSQLGLVPARSLLTGAQAFTVPLECQAAVVQVVGAGQTRRVAAVEASSSIQAHDHVLPGSCRPTVCRCPRRARYWRSRRPLPPPPAGPDGARGLQRGSWRRPPPRQHLRPQRAARAMPLQNQPVPQVSSPSWPRSFSAPKPSGTRGLGARRPAAMVLKIGEVRVPAATAAAPPDWAACGFRRAPCAAIAVDDALTTSIAGMMRFPRPLPPPDLLPGSCRTGVRVLGKVLLAQLVQAGFVDPAVSHGMP